MIIVDLANMRIVRRLNATTINGYAGYCGKAKDDEGYFLIIAIPFEEPGVARLMEEI